MIGISSGRTLNNFIPIIIPEVVFNSSLGNLALLSSIGARLLFNMKEAGSKGLNEGMGTSARSKGTISGMDFAAPPPVQTSGASHGDGEQMAEEIEVAEV